MPGRTLFWAGLLIVASGCAIEPVGSAAPASPSQHETQSVDAAAVVRVEPALVCMVNNHYMGKPQIPVAVDGKTYFGCCEMCKSKLQQDRSSRFATDPTSGAPVDKASAVIGKTSSGTILYFENEANLKRYMPQDGA